MTNEQIKAQATAYYESLSKHPMSGEEVIKHLVDFTEKIQFGITHTNDYVDALKSDVEKLLATRDELQVKINKLALENSKLSLNLGLVEKAFLSRKAIENDLINKASKLVHDNYHATSRIFRQIHLINVDPQYQLYNCPHEKQLKIIEMSNTLSREQMDEMYRLLKLILEGQSKEASISNNTLQMIKSELHLIAISANEKAENNKDRQLSEAYIEATSCLQVANYILEKFN